MMVQNGDLEPVSITDGTGGRLRLVHRQLARELD